MSWKKAMRSPRRRGGGARGQAAVEFALVALPCLTLLFAVTSFGYALYTYSFVSSAARNAVRYAIVHGSHSLSPATSTAITNYVKNQLQGLSASDLSVTSCWNPQSGTCPGPSGNNDPGKVVSVTVTYNFQPLFGMPAVTLPLTSSSQMVIAY
ncbi:MAG TPA: TadE/TadG family type IV pilus assembly protein [Candidatus Binataceae bacterium]|nr:TadE/TadG family type IV pilus assembly protein [Candidatus Binataceae bacterium]